MKDRTGKRIAVRQKGLVINMRYEKKFYRCTHCGNMVSFLDNKGVDVICCGEPMKELVPNTVDAAQEKHVPVARREGEKIIVSVGSTLHPMLDEHYINWIAVTSKNRTQRITLNPGESPTAEFCVGSEPVTVYEYCNLHGLWAADL